MIVWLVQLVASYKTLIFGSFDLPWIRPNVANSETMLTKNQAECIFSFPVSLIEWPRWIVVFLLRIGTLYLPLAAGALVAPPTEMNEDINFRNFIS